MRGRSGLSFNGSSIADKPSSNSFAKIFSLAGRTRSGL
jgi:hypothetical protein